MNNVIIVLVENLNNINFTEFFRSSGELFFSSSLSAIPHAMSHPPCNKSFLLNFHFRCRRHSFAFVAQSLHFKSAFHERVFWRLLWGCQWRRKLKLKPAEAMQQPTNPHSSTINFSTHEFRGAPTGCIERTLCHSITGMSNCRAIFKLSGCSISCEAHELGESGQSRMSPIVD